MPNTHQPHSTLIDHLKELPDPRVNRTRYHELTDILVISICTLLCGGESFYDMEDFGKAKQDWRTIELFGNATEKRMGFRPQRGVA